MSAPEAGFAARAERLEREVLGVGVAHFERRDLPARDLPAAEAGAAEQPLRIVEDLRTVGDAADVFHVEAQGPETRLRRQFQRLAVVCHGPLELPVHVDRGVVAHVFQFQQGLPFGNGDRCLVEDVSEFHSHIVHREQFVGFADLAVNLRQRGGFDHFQLLRPSPEHAEGETAEQKDCLFHGLRFSA